MSLFSRLFQYYFNNKHNLLLLILVACAIAISLLPQLLVSPPNDGQVIQSDSGRKDQLSGSNAFELQFSNKKLEQELNQTKLEYEYLKNEVHHLTYQLRSLQEQLQQQQLEQEQSRFHPKMQPQESSETEGSMSCTSAFDGNSSNSVTDFNEERLQQISQQYQELQKNQGYLYDTFQEFKEFTNNQFESFQLMVYTKNSDIDDKLNQLAASFDDKRESIDQIMTRINGKINHLEEVVTHTREMAEQYEGRLLELQDAVKASHISEPRTQEPQQQQATPSPNQEEIEEFIRKTVNEKVHTIVQSCQSSSPSLDPSSSSSSQLEQYSPEDMNAPHDYALLASGSEILFDQTSNTYVPSYYQLKSLYHSILKKSGLEEYLPSSNHIPEIEYSHSWTESFHNFYGVGSVEDVLKPGMRLGHCWPMKVRKPVVVLLLFLFLGFVIREIKDN
jgi:predicted nuclease with TOPRIM domain